MVANDIGAVRVPTRSARPSPVEIDAAILDTAAEVFARHGFAGTSVQQVADAVGYSKTGLLRRFPSKQALYDAVVDHVSEQLRLLRERTVRGPGAGREIVRTTASAAFANPGAVLLMLEAMRPSTDLPHAGRLGDLAELLVDDLTLDLTDGRDQLRAVLAIQLVANAALLTITPEAQAFGVSPAQVHDLAVELASDVLGGSHTP